MISASFHRLLAILVLLLFVGPDFASAESGYRYSVGARGDGPFFTEEELLKRLPNFTAAQLRAFRAESSFSERTRLLIQRELDIRARGQSRKVEDDSSQVQVENLSDNELEFALRKREFVENPSALNEHNVRVFQAELAKRKSFKETTEKAARMFGGSGLLVTPPSSDEKLSRDSLTQPLMVVEPRKSQLSPVRPPEVPTWLGPSAAVGVRSPHAEPSVGAPTGHPIYVAGRDAKGPLNPQGFLIPEYGGSTGQSRWAELMEGFSTIPPLSSSSARFVLEKEMVGAKLARCLEESTADGEKAYRDFTAILHIQKTKNPLAFEDNYQTQLEPTTRREFYQFELEPELLKERRPPVPMKPGGPLDNGLPRVKGSGVYLPVMEQGEAAELHWKRAVSHGETLDLFSLVSPGKSLFCSVEHASDGSDRESQTIRLGLPNRQQKDKEITETVKGGRPSVEVYQIKSEGPRVFLDLDRNDTIALEPFRVNPIGKDLLEVVPERSDFPPVSARLKVEGRKHGHIQVRRMKNTEGIGEFPVETEYEVTQTSPDTWETSSDRTIVDQKRRIRLSRSDKDSQFHLELVDPVHGVTELTTSDDVWPQIDTESVLRLFAPLLMEAEVRGEMFEDATVRLGDIYLYTDESGVTRVSQSGWRLPLKSYFPGIPTLIRESGKGQERKFRKMVYRNPMDWTPGRKGRSWDGRTLEVRLNFSSGEMLVESNGDLLYADVDVVKGLVREVGFLPLLDKSGKPVKDSGGQPLKMEQGSRVKRWGYEGVVQHVWADKKITVKFSDGKEKIFELKDVTLLP